MLGIDVSHHNEPIDWLTVSRNIPKIEFVVIKASEGVNNPDSQFINNASGAIRNNIPWGAYHFATWNMYDAVADAKSECAYFIKVLNMVPHPPNTVWLDVETNSTNIILSPAKVELYITTFLAQLTAAGFTDNGIYSSAGFINSFLPTFHKLGNTKLWQADYRTVPILPHGFTKRVMLQYTDKGRVNGINAYVDLNKK